MILDEGGPLEPWSPGYDVTQPSLHSFQRLAHIELPQSQLIDMSTYKPAQIEYNADDSINLEKSSFGTTFRINILTFLPP